MSDYTKLTNFAVKDGYTTGNPAKVIKGTELDDEFNAIATAVATKVDSTDVIPVTTGGTGSTTAAAARIALGLAIGTDVPSPTGTGASGTWGINITGNAATATSATTATTATTANAVSSTATGTTQAISDDSTKLATTEFVKDVNIGWGQTWQNVTASRAAGTTYTNSTGRPIMVVISLYNSGDTSFNYQFYVNGTKMIESFGGGFSGDTFSAVIPSGDTYRITVSSTAINIWAELR